MGQTAAEFIFFEKVAITHTNRMAFEGFCSSSLRLKVHSLNSAFTVVTCKHCSYRIVLIGVVLTFGKAWIGLSTQTFILCVQDK